MGQLSGPRSFFPVERGMVDLLAKACAHAGIKAIGVKTTMITSAIFCRRPFNLKKKHGIRSGMRHLANCVRKEVFNVSKHEQMEGRFLPGSLAMYFSYFGGIVG